MYPALAVAAALTERARGSSEAPAQVELLWVGSPAGPECDLVAREGIPFEAVSSGPLVGVGLRAVPSAARIIAGTWQALRLVRRFRPQALLITGGWVTIPAALACWLNRVPILIELPDIEPGGTIKVLARIAARVAVPAEESTRFFRPGQAVVTGYPVRPALLAAAGFDPLGRPLKGKEAKAEQAAARRIFGLSESLPVVLVFGGSKGARSINRALMAALPRLLRICQVIHISGSLDWPEVQEQAATLPPNLAGRYHAVEYLHSDQMAQALASADLVVSRAGASVLGEFPLFGLPAILVPYPHAWRYQKTNADVLVSRGAALRLDDERLTDELGSLVRVVLADPDRRQWMVTAARSMARPDAAARVAEELTHLAEGRSGAPARP